MRRLLSLLLSAVMVLSMFSVLGVVASADSEVDTEIGTDVPPEIGDDAEGGDDIGGENVPEGDLPEEGEDEENPETPDNNYGYESLSFVPAEAIECYPFTYGGWAWVYDEQTDSYGFLFDYWLLDVLYSEGNVLSFTDFEGNVTTYTCDEDLCYVDENGEYLDEEPLYSYIENEDDGSLVFYVEYGNLVAEYPVVFNESEVESIELLSQEPIVLDAYREGYYARLSSGDNMGEIAYYYDTMYNSDFRFKVVYKDGTEKIVSVDKHGDLVYDDGEQVSSFYTITEKSSQEYMEWEPGNTYTVEYFFEGIPFEVEYYVTENTVIGIDYIQSSEPAALIYGVDGYYSECSHEECAYMDNYYFEFDQTEVFPVDGDLITVTYSDYTSEVFRWKNGRLYNEDGTEVLNYSVCLYDDQAENHWGIGEYTFTVECFGYCDTVKVRTADREVENISVKMSEEVQIVEYTSGYWYGEGEDQKFIYRYDHHIDKIYIEVSYTEGLSDFFWYDDEVEWFVDDFGRELPYSIFAEDTQLTEPWSVGWQEVEVSVGGYTSVVGGYIVASPVESIDFIVAETPVFKYQDEENGYWYSEGEGDAYTEFFVYDFSAFNPFAEGNKIIVSYTDGRTDTYNYDVEAGGFVNEDGTSVSEEYPLNFSDNQEYSNWTPESDENYIIVEYVGSRDYINVVIDDGSKPVAAKVERLTNVVDGVEITWSKVSNATEYMVYRRLENAGGKASSNPWVYVGSTTELSFVDTTDLVDGAYYKYHIHTVNGNGKSAYNGATALTTRYIAAVSNFKVTNTKSGVLFNWDRVSGYTIHLFRLEKGASEWVYLGSKESNASYVCNVNAVSGKTYMYAAYYEKNGTSAIVYSDYITYLSEPHLKTISNAVTGIYFNWTKVEGAVGYRVYRRAAGEKYFTYLGTTTNLWYCDNAVRNNNGTYYKYTVKAIAEDGSMSSYEGGLLLRRLVIPYIQSLTNNTNGITVKWAEIPGATSYRVYRRGAGQTTWTYLASVTGLTYTDTAVKNNSGSYYRYTVKAVVNGVFTSYNPDGPYTMRLSTPTLKSAVEVENGIQVKWNAVKGAGGYQVYRKTADTTWVLIDTVSGTTYVDKTALPGVEYTYTVRAYKGSYRSSYIPEGVSARFGIAE